MSAKGTCCWSPSWRLARSTSDLYGVIDKLREKSVGTFPEIARAARGFE
jgi:hypothetical protein